MKNDRRSIMTSRVTIGIVSTAAVIFAIEFVMMFFAGVLEREPANPSWYFVWHILAIFLASIVISGLLYYLVYSKINKNEERINAIFETLHEGVVLNEMVFNEKGEMVDYRILEVNDSFYRLADFVGEGSVIGRLATEVYKLDPDPIKAFWEDHKDRQSTLYFEFVSPISQKIFEIRTSPFRNSKFVVSFHDITERKKAEQEILEKERMLEETQRIAGLGSYSYDIRSAESKVTGTFRSIFGVDDRYAMNMDKWTEFVHPDDRDELLEYLQEGFTGSMEYFERDYRIVRQNDNQIRWIRALGKFVRGESGDIVQVEGTIQDITDKKDTEEQIQRLAYFDHLTDLPNRALMRDRLHYILSLARRNKGTFALLFIDLDQFKGINDTLGHSVGDELLKSVARRLKESLREEDVLSRQGGDEYIVALPDADMEGAGTVAMKINAILNQPFRIDQYELSTTASIGIAVYPADGISIETLMKNADTAMYRAKRKGRNNFAL